VDVGLALPQFDYSVPGESPPRWSTVVEWAVRAEHAGFDSVWLADHLFLEVEKYGGPPGRFDAFDPLLGLAALARATTRIKLATLVLCAPLRPPAVLAKMLAGVDRLAGGDGRVIAGIGAGWYEPEFVAAGIPFERPGRRVQQLADAIQTLKAMWTNAEGAPPCNPGPLTPGGPPVWVGGRGDKVMEVAARRADGFNHGGWVDAAGPRRLAEFWATCDRVGRARDTIKLSVNLTVDAPERLPEQLAGFAEQGVATVVIGLGPLPFSVTTFDALDRVASFLP
jgi:alkanesulfonate monooxygenase SsuD/methylene tetrahydromethanopterin reductase-like flavin-dependent oxidoreductase (luciferase family)